MMPNPRKLGIEHDVILIWFGKSHERLPLLKVSYDGKRLCDSTRNVERLLVWRNILILARSVSGDLVPLAEQSLGV
jgi:hypothetical protein